MGFGSRRGKAGRGGVPDDACSVMGVMSTKSFWGGVMRKSAPEYPHYVKASQLYIPSSDAPPSPDMSSIRMDDASTSRLLPAVLARSPSVASDRYTRKPTPRQARKYSTDLGWDVPAAFEDDYYPLATPRCQTASGSHSGLGQSTLYSLKSLSSTYLPGLCGKAKPKVHCEATAAQTSSTASRARAATFTSHVNSSMTSLLRFPLPPPRPAPAPATAPPLRRHHSSVSEFGSAAEPLRPARSASRSRAASPQQWFNHPSPARLPRESHGLMRHGNATTLSLVSDKPPQIAPLLVDPRPFLDTDVHAHIFDVKRRARLASIPDVDVESDGGSDSDIAASDDQEDLGLSLKYALASLPISTYASASPSSLGAAWPSRSSSLLKSRDIYGNIAYSRSSIALSSSSIESDNSDSDGGPLTPCSTTQHQPFEDLFAARPLSPWMVPERRKGSIAFPSRMNASCISLVGRA